MKCFVWYFFCGFKAKREEITNKKIKNNGKNKTDFSRANVLKTKRSETENRLFPTFFSKTATTFFNIWTHKSGVKKRNRVKKKIFLKGE